MLPPKLEKRLHIFGGSCYLRVDDREGQDRDLLELAQQELVRIEQKFSFFWPESVIDRINRSAGTGVVTPLDAESRSLFSYVGALWSQSNHQFDPSTRLLQECYHPDGRPLASAEQLQQMVKLVGWSGLEISDAGAYLSRKGMLIDLNSCVRPYAVDCVRKLLLREGVGNALIELDRDIASIGRQPDGANWLVGVRYPQGSRTAISRLKLNDRGFSRRGEFESRVAIGGENFGRTLSPVDGQPIPGLLSVAVIADNCLAACAAASVARVKTEEAGMRWLEKLGLPWLAIDRELNCHGPLAPQRQ